jgi:hypothetical protein
MSGFDSDYEGDEIDIEERLEFFFAFCLSNKHALKFEDYI